MLMIDAVSLVLPICSNRAIEQIIDISIQGGIIQSSTITWRCYLFTSLLTVMVSAAGKSKVASIWGVTLEKGATKGLRSPTVVLLALV